MGKICSKCIPLWVHNFSLFRSGNVCSQSTLERARRCFYHHSSSQKEYATQDTAHMRPRSYPNHQLRLETKP